MASSSNTTVLIFFALVAGSQAFFLFNSGSKNKAADTRSTPAFQPPWMYGNREVYQAWQPYSFESPGVSLAVPVAVPISAQISEEDDDRKLNRFPWKCIRRLFHIGRGYVIEDSRWWTDNGNIAGNSAQRPAGAVPVSNPEDGRLYTSTSSITVSDTAIPSPTRSSIAPDSWASPAQGSQRSALFAHNNPSLPHTVNHPTRYMFSIGNVL